MSIPKLPILAVPVVPIHGKQITYVFRRYCGNLGNSWYGTQQHHNQDQRDCLSHRGRSPWTILNGYIHHMVAFSLHLMGWISMDKCNLPNVWRKISHSLLPIQIVYCWTEKAKVPGYFWFIKRNTGKGCWSRWLAQRRYSPHAAKDRLESQAGCPNLPGEQW